MQSLDNASFGPGSTLRPKPQIGFSAPESSLEPAPWVHVAGNAAIFLSMFLLMVPGRVFAVDRNNGAISRLALHQQSNMCVRVPA